MTETYLTQPIDEQSARALAEGGLRLSLVDTSDDAAFDEWLRADHRGFLGGRPSDETLRETRDYQRDLRTTGVYDDSIPAAASPVGTANSWIAPLTVPGGAAVGSWAISNVTVAPTHRRRGIARALLGAELRTAHALGVPIAILTVSESVIYGRWGFGPATFASEWRVDTKRVRWAGPATTGTLSFTEPEAYRETGRAVLHAVMASRAGEIEQTPYHADRVIGPLKGNSLADKYRLVRYDSPTGEPEGFVSYVVKDADDFVRHTVDVTYLAAATDEALTALWRYLLELDLVAEVHIDTRGVDEPLHHLVSDVRGARVVGVQDHLWVRILDVPAALGARRYEQDGELTIEVTDDMGFAGGRYRMRVSGGEATVESTTASPDVTLPVASLGSVYLGHDAARHLALAGKLTGDADALDRVFRTAVPPRLSTWF
ncbi:GNAT family N-acetyltransferase [Diaminobutyricibacter tongyongensis]|uniref:GNAT family N-acetyltransferase n=1 Tax=Leifsonia tongyongensis TaxID=1268043 RepID=A0A6L9XUE7_9MICO|nr:GNAT family N-acetyltransferase [Diaminobutyricibacter tongyongensis]